MARKCPNGCGRDGQEMFMHVHPCNVCYTQQKERERINFHRGPTFDGSGHQTSPGDGYPWYDKSKGDRLYPSNTKGWYWLVRTDGHSRPLPPGHGDWGSADTDIYKPGTWDRFAAGPERHPKLWDDRSRGPFRRIAMPGDPPAPYDK